MPETRRLVVIIALFVATWLLWSGHYKPLLLALGAVSCGLVTWLAVRSGFFDGEVYSLHLGPRLPRYWAWLLKEIVRANLDVARIVLDPKLPVAPSIVHVDARDLAPPTQATLANAITLTPGTLSLDVDEGRIEVHCLSEASAADLETGEMLRRAQELERG